MTKEVVDLRDALATDPSHRSLETSSTRGSTLSRSELLRLDSALSLLLARSQQRRCSSVAARELGRYPRIEFSSALRARRVLVQPQPAVS